MTDYQTAERMTLKESAIPIPDLADATVLDVGCDHGHWCRLAQKKGASRVLGLDRGRSVNGQWTDLKEQNRDHEFRSIDLGKQWHEFGKFDVVFCFSMYHHVFENCGDHNAIWYWLWKHTGKELLWEGPTGKDDSVVKLNVSNDYNAVEIFDAAQNYFDVDYVGSAKHVKTRHVFRCVPKKLDAVSYLGKAESGSRGAAKAFQYAKFRRIDEIENALGVRVVPGTLNVRTERAFDWNRNYYRSQILDVRTRPGLDGPWLPRWARFYPVMVSGIPAYAFRFEGEGYKDNFVELIAPVMLRDHIVRSDNRLYVRSC